MAHAHHAKNTEYTEIVRQVPCEGCRLLAIPQSAAAAGSVTH